MKNYITIFLFIPWLCWADDKDRALRYIQKAVVKMPAVKRTTKKVTNIAKRKLHLDNDYVKTAASVAIPIVKGKVSTRDFGNIRYKDGDLQITPQVDYDIRNNNVSSSVTLDFSF